jgi:hypothetical protein
MKSPDSMTPSSSDIHIAPSPQNLYRHDYPYLFSKGVKAPYESPLSAIRVAYDAEHTFIFRTRRWRNDRQTLVHADSVDSALQPDVHGQIIIV